MRSLFRWMRKSKYKKILNTEHKFATLYVINSEQNIFIYYSVQYFTLKKLNLLRLIILPDYTGLDVLKAKFAYAISSSSYWN